MGFRLGQWAKVREHFASSDVPAFSGVSGGRTSGMMAALHGRDVVLTFQNTGREHAKTYDFLERLDEALGKRLVLLEFRPPKKKGAPPREFRFEIVTHKTLARDGSPFSEFLQGLANYRRIHKGLGPISPWAMQRICTAYMKRRVQQRYIESLGIDTYDSFVGLRADEPERVHRLTARDTQDKTFRCPLYDAGITVDHVREFWNRQPFDLELEPHQGNCTACFLKDQGDLARVLGEEETDAGWWLQLEKRYANFGGQNFPGYAQLLLEREPRLAIERELRAGREPTSSGVLEPKRFRLVVLQEKRRLAGERTTFSCNCEASGTITDD
jgi:3'-phosphoadenosine 5'-phosphosulfate sulfotransferase (PAPS reductase)/FAD synthetase